MSKTLYYDHFAWQASIPFDCPLCGVHIPPGERHECSNPKPLPATAPKQPARRKKNATTPDHL